MEEVAIPDLGDDDIYSILTVLKDHGLLGELRNLTPEGQFDLFKTKAKKQILVAMREATKGQRFDEIIKEEFNVVSPPEAQLLLLIAAIPSVHHYGIELRQLIAAMDLPPSQTMALVDENLRGILVPAEKGIGRFMVRHPLIAEHIVANVAERAVLVDCINHS